jgi:hypothetical protein
MRFQMKTHTAGCQLAHWPAQLSRHDNQKDAKQQSESCGDFQRYW